MSAAVMTSPSSKITLPPPNKIDLETAILQTVAYVDGFDYPLTAAEVHHFLIGLPATQQQVEEVLSNGRLIPQQLSHQNGYYMLPGREKIAAIRQQREVNAQQLWPHALRYGRFMAHLPFVRMVSVTGSLAVNNAMEGADIDYLVVTENGRLWLTRAFTIFIVRMAARQGVILCPNYFISCRALQIDQQNLYTAHELVQMVPIAGLDIYYHLQQLNLWTNQYLPNAHWSGNDQAYTPSALHPRRLAELPLRTPLGTYLERWEMQRKMHKFRHQQTGESDFSPRLVQMVTLTNMPDTL